MDGLNSTNNRRQAMKIARYMGCRGAHQDENGNWMPCADRQTLMRISNLAESDEFLNRYEKKSYTKPELRERIKERIMSGSRGGKPGQWSARKAQLLAQEYRKAGGGYRGGRTRKQRSLSKWTREKWRTSDGKPAIRKGGTRRYLPSKAWEKLTPAQRSATNRKKIEGSKKGRQFVANTEVAARARKNSTKSHQPIVLAKSEIDARIDEFMKGKRKKGKRKITGKRWEKLGERGVLGISSLVGGGIVSEPFIMKMIDMRSQIKNDLLSMRRKLTPPNE